MSETKPAAEKLAAAKADRVTEIIEKVEAARERVEKRPTLNAELGAVFGDKEQREAAASVLRAAAETEAGRRDPLRGKLRSAHAALVGRTI